MSALIKGRTHRFAPTLGIRMVFSCFKNQKGVSLIAAVAAMLLLAVLGVVFASMVSVNQQSIVNHLQSTQAFFIADGGLERVIRFLLSPTLSERAACSSINGNANLTNISLGTGLFTVTTESGSPFYSTTATTLTSNITSTDTTIPVNSIASYASYGRIMIDREIIDYTGTTATSFTGALRGRDGTTPASHVSGTRVGQDQCTVTSTGGVPGLTSDSSGKRVLRQAAMLQEGWAVADSGEILRWDGVNWSLFATTGTRLRGVSMDSYTNGWVVGDVEAVTGRAQIRRWNPDGTPAWDSAGVPGEATVQLNAVHTISQNEAWAVGNDVGGGTDSLILRWQGGPNWSYQDPAGNVDINLNNLHMLDTNNDGIADAGWAVGDRVNCGGGNRLHTIMRWNGTNWSLLASPEVPACSTNNETLRGVFTLSNEAWTVGDRYQGSCGGGNRLHNIMRWNGTNWSLLSPPDVPTCSNNRNLTAIYMLDLDSDGDADDGWAVGQQGTILRWNGTNWTAYASPTNQELMSVFMLSQTEGFAAGNGGVILHWDGSSWTTVASGVGQRLNGISLVGPRTRPQAMWREVYN